MFLLRNNEQFSDIVTYDADNRSWQRLDYERRQNVVPADIAGFFAILSSKFCAMFRSGQEIIVCVGDVQVPLSHRVKINVTGNPEKRRLTISQDANVIVNHEYCVDTSNQFENDPTPFIEDEDYDFGLFMANIAGSQVRQEVLKGNA
jgi:hypothetical protein